MILQFGFQGGPYVNMDDEITDQRMTPEVMDDYLHRLRKHVTQAYQEMAAYDEALHEGDEGE